MNNWKIWILGIIMVFLTVSSAMGNTYPNTVSSFNIEQGFHSSGNIMNLLTYDLNSFVIDEVDEDIGLDFTVNIDGVIGVVDKIIINARYIGGVNHKVEVLIFDYDVNDFFYLYEFSNNPNYDYIFINISGMNVINEFGDVIVRFYHPDSGISSHYFEIDYLLLTSIINDEVNDEVIDWFSFDFNDTFVIVLFGLFVLLASVLCFGNFFEGSFMVGSVLFMMLGLILIFNSIMTLFGLLLVIGGFIGLFVED